MYTTVAIYFDELKSRRPPSNGEMPDEPLRFRFSFGLTERSEFLKTIISAALMVQLMPDIVLSLD
jgi:hypothetical protein